MTPARPPAVVDGSALQALIEQRVEVPTGFIEDEKTGNRWDSRQNPDVPGAVDLLCVVPGAEAWKDRYFRLDCIPLPILEQLVAKARKEIKG